MSKNPRAAQTKQWRINSVYERRRDGRKRVEQAYRILVDAKEVNHNNTRRNG
jgi:hypothetical protein